MQTKSSCGAFVLLLRFLNLHVFGLVVNQVSSFAVPALWNEISVNWYSPLYVSVLRKRSLALFTKNGIRTRSRICAVIAPHVSMQTSIGLAVRLGRNDW